MVLDVSFPLSKNGTSLAWFSVAIIKYPGKWNPWEKGLISSLQECTLSWQESQSSRTHGIQSQESKSNECLWLLSTLSPLTQFRVPSREWCHPQWGGFPTSIAVIEMTLHRHVQMFIAQMILLHSNRVTVDSNHPRVYNLFIRHRTFFLESILQKVKSQEKAFLWPMRYDW